MLVDGRPAGALNLYSPRAGPWTAADDAVVLLLAYQLTGIVQAVKNLAAEVELDPESAQALADRPRLDIATGILMSRYACPESDARTLLHADADFERLASCSALRLA